MPILYLDNNIFSYLHRPEHYIGASWHKHLATIHKYLQDATNEATVIYSPAHLMDVRNGFKKNSAQALDKLQFINTATKGYCLVKDICLKTTSSVSDA